MEYTINEISDIQAIDFPFNVPLKIKYSTKNFDYNLLVKSNKNYDQLVVLSNGAINREKKVPPVFMRSSWLNEINANLIFIDDGTIHNTNLSLGWGQGNTDEFILETYSNIIKEIMTCLTIQDEEVYYFGSSAGGFMSLILSAMHISSSAIVNNPQTDITTYYEAHANPLLERVYGSNPVNYQNYKHRINVVDAFNYYGNVPNVYYIQNQFSAHDIRCHVNPFIKQMKEEDLSIENIIFINYYDEEKGHNPTSESSTLNYLNLLIDRNIFS